MDVLSEAAARRSCSKMVFLKISQYSQENTCVGVSFNKVAGRKKLQHRCFLVNVVKFLRTPYFNEHLPTTASDSGPSSKSSTCELNYTPKI